MFVVNRNDDNRGHMAKYENKRTWWWINDDGLWCCQNEHDEHSERPSTLIKFAHFTYIINVQNWAPKNPLKNIKKKKKKNKQQNTHTKILFHIFK